MNYKICIKIFGCEEIDSVCFVVVVVFFCNQKPQDSKTWQLFEENIQIHFWNLWDEANFADLTSKDMYQN